LDPGDQSHYTQHVNRGDWIKYRDERGIEHITEVGGFSRAVDGALAIETPHGTIKLLRVLECRSRAPQ
jgi:hypothetical protein